MRELFGNLLEVYAQFPKKTLTNAILLSNLTLANNRFFKSAFPVLPKAWISQRLMLLGWLILPPTTRRELGISPLSLVFLSADLILQYVTNLTLVHRLILSPNITGTKNQSWFTTRAVTANTTISTEYRQTIISKYTTTESILNGSY